jgi:amidohydrolase
VTSRDFSLGSVKERIRESVLRDSAELVDLADRLHANPEVAFEESFASDQVAGAMSRAGFDSARGAYGLDTAVVAESGSGPLRIAICAEYDALPDIGHACGHNIIAAAAVGAARALKAPADDLGIGIRLLGTPAEEVGDGGGKILMLREGAWDDVALTMMVHPGPFDDLAPALIAISAFAVEYHGREAHATFFSHLGINAGAAATIAEVALALMRQQLQGHERVHGIIEKFGSSANTLSGYSRLKYMIRSRSVPELEELRSRVLRCFEAGAIATGASMQVVGGSAPYEPLRTDGGVAELFGTNLADFSGREFPPVGSGPPTSAGTDMGNVSVVVPTIHPMLGLGSFPVVNHQAEFTSYCTGDRARQAIIDGAIGMAWTAAEVALSEEHRARLLRSSTS